MAKNEYTRNVAPGRLELLITIVETTRAQYYIGLIQSAGANLQVSTLAKGTAEAEILSYLGVNETSKTAIFSIVREDALDSVFGLLEEKFSTARHGKGVAVSIPLTSVVGTLIYGFLSDDKRIINDNGYESGKRI